MGHGPREGHRGLQGRNPGLGGRGQGLLLSGPPGCGKTLFARALAATCGVALVTGSYAAWLGTGTGHQGDLILSMRKTFSEAKANAPCILFIDEVDAFPDRARLADYNRDWMTQVVNALLAELDGVDGREGVVVVAACNNPHLLDPALVRSGRLDRHIRIRLPDEHALALMFREHLGPDLPSDDLRRTGLLALGCTGADCERFVRGARRRARSAGRPMLLRDLLDEVDDGSGLTEAEMRIAAVHEAGHAVAAVELGARLHRVSLRNTAAHGGGVSAAWPDGGLVSWLGIHARLTYLLAGRAAEEVVLGRITTGAGGSHDSDLAHATLIATAALSAQGMDEDRGLAWTVSARW